LVVVWLGESAEKAANQVCHNRNNGRDNQGGGRWFNFKLRLKKLKIKLVFLYFRIK
jgi:hypothetical protein